VVEPLSRCSDAQSTPNSHRGQRQLGRKRPQSGAGGARDAGHQCVAGASLARL